MSAIFSECFKYRYCLERRIDMRFSKGEIIFVMLNPSTADHQTDDATIRRLMRFAREWRYDRFIVLNLYAFRSTAPKILKKTKDPVGPSNDKFILEALEESSCRIVCAWGNNAGKDRVCEFMKLVGERELWCFGVNKSGMPKHPLYVPADRSLIRYKPYGS